MPAKWQTALGAADRLALAEQGFLLVRAAADAAALHAMRIAWDRLLAEPFDGKRGNNDGPSDLAKEPAFQRCLEHPYVMSAVAQLLDGDVRLLGFRGRDPQRGSGQQGFHVDSSHTVPPHRQVIANVFWVLDDMDETNGATRLVPGTHRLTRLPPKGFQQRDAQHPEARSIAAHAGDVLVFTAHLWHAGSQNKSGAHRRIAMAHFGREEVAESYARMALPLPYG